MKSLLLALAAAAIGATARAQAPAVPLDAYVVSASRTPQDPTLTPSDVVRVPLADLQAAQVPDLRSALAAIPGVIVVNTGAPGGQSSLFLRGADDDQTLFVVDGVRLNTSTATYFNFLGGADLAGLDRFEVLLGPQSTLYGSSATGGVVLLDTAHGAGAPAGTVSAYAGSFASFGAQAAVAGSDGGFGYSASLGHTATENERPYNAYKNWTYSARTEEKISPVLLVGATVRGLSGHQEEPGPVTYPSAGDVQNATDLVTAYAEAKPAETFTSRLTAGWYQDQYTFNDGSPYDFYFARNTRDILDWQNTWRARPWAEIVAGVNEEWSHFQSGGLIADRALAEYLSSTLRTWAALALTLGLRHDDFTSDGGATTGRAGAAYIVNGGATKFRATYGTGFTAPTPADRYGSPPYYLPNPGLRPESSRGWDAGIDQKFLSGALTARATYFQSRFTDLLEYEVVDPVTYAGEEINVDRATTGGAEFGLDGALSQILSLRLAYTYLDTRDDLTQQPLLRRPRHTADGALQAQLTRDWLAGLGAHAVADRQDGFPPAPLAGYTTLRLYTQYAVRPGLKLKFRIENLGNRAYQEVAGYPALPRGYFGGVEWDY